MLSAYRNELYRSKKWAPEDPEDMKRKVKRTELLDCVFSENADGLGVQDLPDECQRSVEDVVIMQEESAELHKKIEQLSEHGGDIKAVQGDSGHAQASMVTEVYSHIIDEDRRNNAALLEEAFYNKKNLTP